MIDPYLPESKDRPGRYFLFFHGSPQASFHETYEDATLACEFTDDFVTFSNKPYL